MELSELTLQDLLLWRKRCIKNVNHFEKLGDKYDDKWKYWCNAATKVESELYYREEALFGVKPGRSKQKTFIGGN